MTNQCAYRTINPQIGFSAMFPVIVTDDFCSYLSNEALTVEVRLSFHAVVRRPVLHSTTCGVRARVCLHAGYGQSGH
jgi:hypothetical protein